MIEKISIVCQLIAVGFNQRNNNQHTKGFSQKNALLNLAKAQTCHLSGSVG
jgi:hypothetical protein